MNKFKSKKGFTLAELLIVVAIIAVLVAIAVPLFVTGLKKAEDATLHANEHAVRSAAVTKILSMDSTDPLYSSIYETDGTLVDKIWATADVSEAGDIGPITLHIADPEGIVSGKKEGGGYTIKVVLTDILHTT